MARRINRDIKHIDKQEIYLIENRYARKGKLSAKDIERLLTIVKEAKDELDFVSDCVNNMKWIERSSNLEGRVLYADNEPLPEYDDYNEYKNKVDNLDSRMDEIEEFINSIRSALP